MTNESGIPSGLSLPRAIWLELPRERETLLKDLWGKSGGLCALCGLPLPSEHKRIDVDHVKPRAAGGLTTLANLFLAHSACNRSKGKLDFNIARPVIEFQAWARQHVRCTFDDVLEKYIRQGKKRVEIQLSGEVIKLKFGGTAREAALYSDPATSTKYCFVNVPTDYIFNDTMSQPRVINHEHVRKLAVDFSRHPVHEPSNSRLVTLDHGLAELHQFDGQHKTTAQIILQRGEVPMKLYIDPELPMIQELVVQIQQGIKKQPLSTSDTLRKLDDVIRDKVQAYKANHQGKVPTEKELVAAQPKSEQQEFKKRLLSNFCYLVFREPEFKLRDYVSTKSDKTKPMTDSVLIKKVIQPLISQELIDEPLDGANQRERERSTIIRILNVLAEEMLEGKWSPATNSSDNENIHTQRARNFFYQGSLTWTFGKILKPTWVNWMPLQLERKLFVQGMDADQEERILTSVKDVCGWAIWSTADPEKMAAMRSNTVQNVVKAFPEYDQRVLTHWR